MNIEYRKMPVEYRIEGESKKITGHAAVFDTPAEIYGFTEIIRKGAFADSILKDDIKMLWNHNPDYVLGRNKSGTLRLSEDDIGLKTDNDPPDTQWANDLIVSMQRGDIDQMSFGFTVDEERWIHNQDGSETREILKAGLYDVSPVTFPAYKETDVKVALRNAPTDVRAKILNSEGSQVTPKDKNTEQTQGLMLNKKLKII